MRVEVIMLPRLRSEALSMPRKVFVERYPSVFLVAMGFLSAEELRAKTPSNTKATWNVVLGDRLKHDAKEFEMNRFIKGETKIMVATTVIEVGVDIPNASVMVVENAERFGLSQLHQLRGRVGRGAEQSYCILMSGHKLTEEGKVRLKTMTESTDGFLIAETDLRLRGPGDMAGTQQSGVLDLKIANLLRDEKILKYARDLAEEILEKDPTLKLPKNHILNITLEAINKNQPDWGAIS
jgi:ATP-dependent DNA helicase RecG